MHNFILDSINTTWQFLRQFNNLNFVPEVFNYFICTQQPSPFNILPISELFLALTDTISKLIICSNNTVFRF